MSKIIFENIEIKLIPIIIKKRNKPGLNISMKFFNYLGSFMELFNKKFFDSLFILTVLICFGTIKVEGMGSQESINPFAPLYDLCHECINETSIKKACNDSFGRICAMVVHDKNPSESIRWLENQPRVEINTLFLILKEQINHEWAPILCVCVTQLQMARACMA